MRKLLRANLARMFHSRALFIMAAVLAAVGYKLCRNLHLLSQGNGVQGAVESVFFRSHVFVCVGMALFANLFIGTEYSDGGMRNKLIVGSARRDIYLANLLTCFAAGLVLNLAYALVAGLYGFATMGFFRSSAVILLQCTASGLLLTLSLASLYTLVSMMIQNKTLTVIVCLLGVAAALLVALRVQGSLTEPPFYTGWMPAPDGGRYVENIPNIRYLSDAQRPVYQAVFDLLPTGQALQIGNMHMPHPYRMMLFSAALTLGFTACGLWFFDRKDLK